MASLALDFANLAQIPWSVVSDDLLFLFWFESRDCMIDMSFPGRLDMQSSDFKLSAS